MYRFDKFDADKYTNVCFGKQKAGFAGGVKKRKAAITAFESGIRHTIRTRKQEADSQPLVGETSLCPQTHGLFKSMSEDEIWDLVALATTEERQAVLGSGVLSDKLVDQLPRPGPRELRRKIVYLDWVKRGDARHGYVGSGSAKEGGGKRLCIYERNKYYATYRGCASKDQFGNPHLDEALHDDAEMELRVLLAFSLGARSDLVVLCKPHSPYLSLKYSFRLLMRLCR